MNLIETATLTEEDEVPDLALDCTAQELFKAVATAARDKALYAVVDWLNERYGYLSVRNPARDLKVTLIADGIERPKVATEEKESKVIELGGRDG